MSSLKYFPMGHDGRRVKILPSSDQGTAVTQSELSEEEILEQVDLPAVIARGFWEVGMKTESSWSEKGDAYKDKAWDWALVGGHFLAPVFIERVYRVVVVFQRKGRSLDKSSSYDS